MKNCCKHKKKDKHCVRKSDKKIFKLPRKFSKQKCKKPKGFTMKSSCAPYKDCYKKGGGFTKNMNGKPLQVCSKNPLTGYYRNGYCETGPDDMGTHTVCSKMNKNFLDYTKSKNNDLSSVVKPGQKWCLCEYRWNEAYKDGKAPSVIKKATNNLTKSNIKQNIRKHSQRKTNKRSNHKKKTNKKKQFFFNPNNPKKSFDVYIDKDPSDTIHIKYTTIDDVKHTIKKLEKLYKTNKYSHKRIWQVAMIMKVRLGVLKDKKKQQYKLSERYLQHLSQRTKIKNETNRKKYTFKL